MHSLGLKGGLVTILGLLKESVSLPMFQNYYLMGIKWMRWGQSIFLNPESLATYELLLSN